jgi:hypothetical protein
MNLILKPLLFALCLLAPTVQAQNPLRSNPQETPWINRAWGLRYVLYVTDQRGWEISRDLAEKNNAKPGQKYFRWYSLFKPLKTFAIAQTDDTFERGLSVVHIEFDHNGQVTTPHASPTTLQGKLTTDQYIDLVEGEGQDRRDYTLGIWFTGLGDVSTHWAPALCPTYQQPDAAQILSDGYLYGRFFRAKPGGVAPGGQTFGCREWAYQLYNDRHHYIDVTSYVPKDETYPYGTYIRDFKGWARFGDKKPVIGKHEATWYCLHDCPKGEAPGPIANIHVWASANGWRSPKRPTKSPTFVDPPAKQGTYP